MHLEAVEAGLVAEEKPMQQTDGRKTTGERETERRSDRCPVDQNVMYANEV